MNQVVKVEPLPAPRPSFGLVPKSWEAAMQLANMMASARLVPKDLQKSPADCLMVIQQAIRWDMDPFAVAQECSVIQGKLMYSGKLVAAVVNVRGNLSKRLSFEHTGSGEDRTVLVSGTLHGEQAPRTVTVKLRDAKTNANVWKTQPDQQLAYHGARVWARRHTPELMLGVWSPDEFPASEARPDEIPPIDVSFTQETGELVSDDQLEAIKKLILDAAIPLEQVLSTYGVQELSEFPASRYDEIVGRLNARIAYIASHKKDATQ